MGTSFSDQRELWAAFELMTEEHAAAIPALLATLGACSPLHPDSSLPTRYVDETTERRCFVEVFILRAFGAT